MANLEPMFETPYYAVIFASVRTAGDNGYSEMATRMVAMASSQPGFLGVDSAREEIGITVSYWRDLKSIKRWKADFEHREAQRKGQESWYQSYTVRVARVEREYDFGL